MVDTTDRPSADPSPGPVARASFEDHRSAFGLWCAQRPTTARVAMGLGVAWSLAYLTWRAGWTLGGDARWLSVPLFAGEAVGTLALMALVACAWRPRSGPPRRRRRPEPVDIYVLARDWDIEVLRCTLLACAEVRGATRTWVLHPSRDDVAVLAADLGHRSLVVATDDPVEAVTDAGARTDGALVLVLDGADLPLPDALDGFRAAFDDPWCAVLQLRRGAYNHEGARHLGLGRDIRAVHDEVVLPGLDALGAAHWDGAGALLRREAMLEVGGHHGPAGALEATIALQSKGWSVRARGDVVAMGLAPDDITTILRDDSARRRAAFALLCSARGPWRTPGLTVSQRLGHTATVAERLQVATWARALRWLTITVAVVTTTAPFPLGPSTVGLLWLPAVATATLAATVARGGRLGVADVARLEMTRLTWPSRFVLSARRGVQRRGAHRFTCQEPAVVGGEPATVADVSIQGACVVADSVPEPGSQVLVEMWLDAPDGALVEATTTATVRWRRAEGDRWMAGVDFVSPSRETLDHVARFCGVIRVTEAVRGLPPYLLDFIDDVDRSAPPTPAFFGTTSSPEKTTAGVG